MSHSPAYLPLSLSVHPCLLITHVSHSLLFFVSIYPSFSLNHCLSIDLSLTTTTSLLTNFISVTGSSGSSREQQPSSAGYRVFVSPQRRPSYLYTLETVKKGGGTGRDGGVERGGTALGFEEEVGRLGGGGGGGGGEGKNR